MGDMSIDDNAVDLPIRAQEEPTSIGLAGNANERIPILDDDDDVIVLPQEEPVITEIPDDDEHLPKDTSQEASNCQQESTDSTSPKDTQGASAAVRSDNACGNDHINTEEGSFFVYAFFL